MPDYVWKAMDTAPDFLDTMYSGINCLFHGFGIRKTV